jgi:hypothetical protein
MTVHKIMPVHRKPSSTGSSHRQLQNHQHLRQRQQILPEDQEQSEEQSSGENEEFVDDSNSSSDEGLVIVNNRFLDSNHLNSDSRSKLKRTIAKVSNKVTEVRRKLITGDRGKRVRDFVKEPPVVRLIDRVSFFLGVVTFAATDFILASRPEYFQWLFLAVMPLLIALRIPHYTGLKYKYFLYDFCYVVNGLCVLSMFFNQSVILRRAVFVFANGPLVIAVLAWKNSLVFHSLDKITSLFLHVFPPLLTYCWRWHATPSELALLCPNGAGNCNLDFSSYLLFPLVGYLIWQALYLVKTEVVDRHELIADPGMWTSSRWLTQRPNAMRSLALVVCKKLSVLGKDETFDSEHWKTKIVFIIAQLTYTVVTILPTKFLWESQTLHVGFLMICLLASIWNGAQFYIDVFASTYQAKLTRKTAAEKVLGSGN